MGGTINRVQSGSLWEVKQEPALVDPIEFQRVENYRYIQMV